MSLLTRIARIIRSNIDDISDNQPHKTEPVFDFDESQQAGNSHGHSNTRRHKMDPVEAEYRANLEVGPEANLKEIRASYKKLIRLYHPDLHVSEDTQQEVAADISKQLNEAMNYLEKKLGAENE